MQSLFKKSLLVVAIAAHGTIIAQGGVRAWLGCNSTAAALPAAASAPIAPALPATVTATAPAAEATKAAIPASTATATPGYLARIAACVSAGAATAWGYSLGSLWNLTTEMNNPVVNKLTPQFYANFATNNPYYAATIIRSAAKLGIAAGVSYCAYVAYTKLFGATKVKKAVKKVTAPVADEQSDASLYSASNKN